MGPIIIPSPPLAALAKPGSHCYFNRDIILVNFCDDCQHDFLAFGWVGILDMFVEPRLQRARRLSRRVLPPDVQAAVTGTTIKMSKLSRQCVTKNKKNRGMSTLPVIFHFETAPDPAPTTPLT